MKIAIAGTGHTGLSIVILLAQGNEVDVPDIMAVNPAALTIIKSTMSAGDTDEVRAFSK